MDNLPFLAVSIIVLLFLSAFFSGAETALLSLSRPRVRRMKHGSIGGRAAYNLLQKPQRLLSSVLLGNMFVNTLLTVVCATTLRVLFAGHVAGYRGILLNILIVTPLLMIFGELTPKTVAFAIAEKFAAVAALPLTYFSYLTYPVLVVLQWTTKSLLRLIGIRSEQNLNMTQDELNATLKVSKASGVASGNECELIENIIRFGQSTVKDVMINRNQIIGIKDDLPLQDAFAVALQSQRRFLPVYHQNLDDIWGFITFSDYSEWRDTADAGKLLSEFRTPLETGYNLLPVYPVSTVVPGARIDDLLLKMRRESRRLSVVVDRDGKTVGLLTFGSMIRRIAGASPAREGK